MSLRGELRKMPAWVVLGRVPGGNAYHAVVERSWSMDLVADRTHIFWSGGYFKIDGKATAEEHREKFAKSRPDMTFEVFDVHDENLPIVIDWDRYEDDNEPVSNTLSGVRNKYNARNALFEMK